jgi:hypothetical protein
MRRCRLPTGYRRFFLRERVQRPAQIPDDVIGVFAAHGESDQVVSDTRLFPSLAGETGVRHGGWMLDQCFDPTERNRQRGKLDSLHEDPAGIESAAHAKAQQRTGAIHLLGNQFALRVIGHTRISHPFYGGVLAQHF